MLVTLTNALLRPCAIALIKVLMLALICVVISKNSASAWLTVNVRPQPSSSQSKPFSSTGLMQHQIATVDAVTAATGSTDLDIAKLFLADP